MNILWDDADRSAWDVFHAANHGAWQQDWAYGAAVTALGGRTLRARVLDGRDTVAIAQFTSRRFVGVVGAGLCTRGPVWGPELPISAKRAIYRSLKRTAPIARPGFVVFTPDDPAPAPGVDGMSRLMTGHATVLLDLAAPLDDLRRGLDGKWRNRLTAAEKAGLEVQPMGLKPSQYQWLLHREDEQRRAKGYKALPTGLVEAFQAAKSDRRAGLLGLAVRIGRDAAAGMLFLLHGRSATYHIGWSSPAGRDAGAHNLLLWKAMAILKERGLDQLDLGGVDTASGAGIARFKLGAGGTVRQLAGTYV